MLFSDIDPGPYRNGRRYLAPVNDYRQRLIDRNVFTQLRLSENLNQCGQVDPRVVLAQNHRNSWSASDHGPCYRSDCFRRNIRCTLTRPLKAILPQHQTYPETYSMIWQNDPPPPDFIIPPLLPFHIGFPFSANYPLPLLISAIISPFRPPTDNLFLTKGQAT
ncbi:hypothetical protein EVAR_54114_1 [Eumeta japonica]|uniref:Uncharacterized protein n=1 Tax=Eumeta variegata TaxID=151549 RepID=A0A4C1YWI4_EUMVA|nr:hypothetical protein EVAR_54114_1 [Eumeta japonica]